MRIRKNIIKLVTFAFILTVGLLINAQNADAANIIPNSASNTSYNSYGKSYFVTTATGYARVFSDEDNLYVEEYSKDFKCTKRITIKNELDVYGGFYSGKDAYYFVFGKYNTKEVVGSEVIRVVKYSKSWTRISSASIVDDDNFTHDTRYPFWGGTFDMEECGGNLYIATGHQSYVDPAYNMGHQGYILFVVNEKTMKGQLADADNWHSFSQYIACKDANTFYLAEESEGSRRETISCNTYDPNSQNSWGNSVSSTSISGLEYGGNRTSAWAIPTYASVDGIALSKNNVLTIGTSIDQSKYEDSTYTKKYNIYLTVTPINNFTTAATNFKWLSTDGNQNFISQAYLVKISDNRYAVMWQQTPTNEVKATDKTDSLSQSRTKYVIIDGNGNIITQQRTMNAPLSDCEPIVSNGNIVYYASNAGSVNFYTLNPTSGKLTKKQYRIAGENCTWSFADGVLTIQGSGAMSDSFSAYSLVGIRDDIKAVLIQNGITKISKGAFSNLPNLKVVTIENGVQAIDEKAFSGMRSLTTVTIPASVKSIAEGCFNTGWYWIGSGNPVISVNIKCPKGSYAEKFAKKYSISYATTTQNKSGYSQGINPADMGIKVGKKFSVSSANAKFVVTKIGDTESTVKYVGCLKASKKIVIPSTVTFMGTTYKVTSVNSKALFNNKKVTSVIIGKNVTTIGANAFNKCKNLRSITIKSTQLKKIGKNAIKGTNKKLKMIVPKKKLNVYKRLFSNKGVKNLVVKGK